LIEILTALNTDVVGLMKKDTSSREANDTKGYLQTVASYFEKINPVYSSKKMAPKLRDISKV
jgi:hypothetical protein